jgi:hypothetical protein
VAAITIKNLFADQARGVEKRTLAALSFQRPS